VIIRYPNSFNQASTTTGSPTLSTANNYIEYFFANSGSITW